MKTPCSLLIFLSLFWLSSAANAYPTAIAKGYTNCGSCHYSPTGGGMLNSYGHGSQEAVLPDLLPFSALASMREKLSKPDVTGYTEDGAEKLQIDGGFDARLLLINAQKELSEPKELSAIPMLSELGTAIAHGPLVLYGSITPRRTGTAQKPNTLFSREHWLAVKMGDALTLRAGRIVLPYGLRLPDHTAYTREDLGFDKWGQSYALEIDHASEFWMLSAAGFAGDLLHVPTDLQQRGLVVSAARNIPGQAALGLSALGSTGQTFRQAQAGPFFRAKLWQRLYAMGELSAYRRSAQHGSEQQSGAAGLLRTGWFAKEALDFFLEAGWRGVAQHGELAKQRLAIGGVWQILPWLECSPLWQQETTDSGKLRQGAFQVHAFF